MTITEINNAIKSVDANQVSDGYHTFSELYDHRIALFKVLCRTQQDSSFGYGGETPIWRSKTHSDGSVWDGWFILGMEKAAGKQITYHLPLSDWDACDFAETLDKAPEWDGHTSADVLQRLKAL